MTDEDRQLIDRIAAGGKTGEQAVAELFRRYAARIKLHFLRHRMSEEDAGDLLQETMMKIVRGAENFRSEAKVSTWIWSIAHHAMLDHVRRPALDCDDIDALNEELGDRWQLAAVQSAQAASSERRAELERDDCVETQFGEFSAGNPACGRALELKAFEGMSVRELADVLRRTEGATREFLSQCRKKLKPFLEPCLTLQND